jgi:glucosyl-dolichyl phosphate glucuronosyltransferase
MSSDSESEYMDLTVLISTWNSCERLSITLDAFSQCVIPDGLEWQLVIVNNNCNDDTDTIVARYAQKLPITYVKEPRPGLSIARNTGLQAATGKLIIFTDDDVKPSREWIKVYWDAYCECPSGYFWGGPVESEFETQAPEPALLRLAPYSVRGLDWGPKSMTLPPKQYFISANWAAPLEVIRESGGFDPLLGLNPDAKKLITGEESDLMGRLSGKGLTGVYLPGARIRHFVPQEKCTLEHIVRRCEAGALENLDKYRYRLDSVVWLSIPVGIYVHALYYCMRYVAKRLLLKSGSDEYIKLRIALTVAAAQWRNLRTAPTVLKDN